MEVIFLIALMMIAVAAICLFIHRLGWTLVFGSTGVGLLLLLALTKVLF